MTVNRRTSFERVTRYTMDQTAVVVCRASRVEGLSIDPIFSSLGEQNELFCCRYYYLVSHLCKENGKYQADEANPGNSIKARIKRATPILLR